MFVNVIYIIEVSCCISTYKIKNNYFMTTIIRQLLKIYKNIARNKAIIVHYLLSNNVFNYITQFYLRKNK